MSIAFRDLPVYDLQGATRNFEQLTPTVGSLEEKVASLETKVTTLESTRILAKGIGEFEWPGASHTSNEAIIPFGTTVPVTALVMMQPIKTPAIATTMITVFVSKTATEFIMFAYDPEGEPGKAKSKFNWIVVKN